MSALYVNVVTGTIDEVNGDSYLIFPENLPEEAFELDAFELVELALLHGAAEDLDR